MQMYNETIKLISESRAVNEYGDLITTETERIIFAKMKSIGQTEFYQAQALGLKPEIKFVLADYLDYQNEEKLRYQAFNEAAEQDYSIIRTFRSGNSLELVCKRGVG